MSHKIIIIDDDIDLVEANLGVFERGSLQVYGDQLAAAFIRVQTLDEMAADETGCAGQQNGLPQLGTARFDTFAARRLCSVCHCPTPLFRP